MQEVGGHIDATHAVARDGQLRSAKQPSAYLHLLAGDPVARRGPAQQPDQNHDHHTDQAEHLAVTAAVAEQHQGQQRRYRTTHLADRVHQQHPWIQPAPSQLAPASGSKRARSRLRGSLRSLLALTVPAVLFAAAGLAALTPRAHGASGLFAAAGLAALTPRAHGASGLFAAAGLAALTPRTHAPATVRGAGLAALTRRHVASPAVIAVVAVSAATSAAAVWRAGRGYAADRPPTRW